MARSIGKAELAPTAVVTARSAATWEVGFAGREPSKADLRNMLRALGAAARERGLIPSECLMAVVWEPSKGGED